MPSYEATLREQYKNVRERLRGAQPQLGRIPMGKPRPIRGRLANQPWPSSRRLEVNYHVWFEMPAHVDPAGHLSTLTIDGYRYDVCGRHLISAADLQDATSIEPDVRAARDEMMWFLHVVKNWAVRRVANFMGIRELKNCMRGVRRHEARIQQQENQSDGEEESSTGANVCDRRQPACGHG